MVTIQSPIPEIQAPLCWFWLEPIRGRVFSDYGPKSAEEFVKQEWLPSLNSWAVVDEDGETQACAFIRGDEEPGTVRLFLYWRKPSVVVDALRQIVDDVFRAGDVHRIEYRPWADAMNVANVCRQAGGLREGHLRKASMRNGRRADQALYVWTKE